MSQNGIRYSDEFKQQIVDLYRAGTPVAKLSSEYGVSTVTIYAWIKNLSPMVVSKDETMTVKESLLGVSSKTTIQERENILNRDINTSTINVSTKNKMS